MAYGNWNSAKRKIKLPSAKTSQSRYWCRSRSNRRSPASCNKSIGSGIAARSKCPGNGKASVCCSTLARSIGKPRYCVNGKEIGTHRGGYDPFSFDITDLLNPTGDQELIVKVFDPTSNGPQPRGKQMLNGGECFYTPSTGIWQTVWLEPVPASRINRLVMVPDIDNSCLKLKVEGIGADNCTVEAIARDGQTAVASASGKAGEEIKLEVPKDKLKLWSPDTPFLYDLTVSLIAMAKRSTR